MALGWSEGRNLRIDVRWAHLATKTARLYLQKSYETASEVILSNTTPATQHTSGDQEQFRSIRACIRSGPRGLRRELGAPGGNITGFMNFRADDGRQMAGSAYGDHARTTRVTLMLNPETAPHMRNFYLGSLEAAATKYDVKAFSSHVRRETDIEEVIYSGNADSV